VLINQSIYYLYFGPLQCYLDLDYSGIHSCHWSKIQVVNRLVDKHEYSKHLAYFFQTAVQPETFKEKVVDTVSNIKVIGKAPTLEPTTSLLGLHNR
jgi:hypothetical protein